MGCQSLSILLFGLLKKTAFVMNEVCVNKRRNNKKSDGTSALLQSKQPKLSFCGIIHFDQKSGCFLNLLFEAILATSISPFQMSSFPLFYLNSLNLLEQSLTFIKELLTEKKKTKRGLQSLQLSLGTLHVFSSSLWRCV